jgi:hypothetical protein
VTRCLNSSGALEAVTGEKPVVDLRGPFVVGRFLFFVGGTRISPNKTSAIV